MITDKIKTQDALADTACREKAAGKTVGFTNGCFDILHLGHVKYLNAAKGECDILVIGVNSDASVKRLKGEERPVNPQQARAEVLASLENVDYLTIFDEDTPETLIKKINPDVIFKGGDWEEKDIVGADHVRSYGGKVCVVPYVQGYSTTEFIDHIKEST